VLLPQLEKKTEITIDHLRRGLLWVLTGYFLKVVAADSIAPLVNEAYGNYSTIGGPILFLATWGFAIQIFGDFAGYTLIARGISEWFGIRLMENFRSPYLSQSPREFWQRWHISLSTWFQQYLYTPIALAFARRNWLGKDFLPILITMTIIGLWHGAGWNFIVFGFYWGALLAAYMFYLKTSKRFALKNPTSLLSKFQKSNLPFIAFLKASTIFLLTLISFVFFRSPDLHTAISILNSWVTDWHFDNSIVLYLKSVTLLFSLIWIYGWIQHIKNDQDFILQSPNWIRWSVYGFILLSLLSIGFRPVPFIYFQF
jgi:D-alanyl-lipoteichoic acid acyltransferase DltB (MBOAT superfamily)